MMTTQTLQQPIIVPGTETLLGQFAVEALLEELHLTPKPGLVDRRSSGNHDDLNLSLMESSAKNLYDTFCYMALAAKGKGVNQALREQLAAIGRAGEQRMMISTRNINTHKGAIWCLGLLIGSTALLLQRQGAETVTKENILRTAGQIAEFRDRYMPTQNTNGNKVKERYNVITAREEAILGFPTLLHTAIPTWESFADETEDVRKLNVLLAVISKVDDTCILHRSSMKVLKTIQVMAGAILERGGMGISKNLSSYAALEKYMKKHWVSPGGSADMLSACIYIHKISDHFKIN